jgi:hypothetical protein
LCQKLLNTISTTYEPSDGGGGVGGWVGGKETPLQSGRTKLRDNPSLQSAILNTSTLHIKVFMCVQPWFLHRTPLSGNC